MLGNISPVGSYMPPHAHREQAALTNTNYSILSNSDQSRFEQSTLTFKNPIDSAAQRNCRANTEQQQSTALKRIADLMHAADQSLPAYNASQNDPGSPQFAIGLIREAIKENFDSPSRMLTALFEKIQDWNSSSQSNKIPAANFFLGLSPHLPHKGVREYLRASFTKHFSLDFFKQLTSKNLIEFLSALDCIFPVTLESNKVFIDLSEKRSAGYSAAIHAQVGQTIAGSSKRNHSEAEVSNNPTTQSQVKKSKTHQNVVLTAEEIKIYLRNPEISEKDIAELTLSAISKNRVRKKNLLTDRIAMQKLLDSEISIKHFLTCLNLCRDWNLKNFVKIYLVSALEKNPEIEKLFDQSVNLSNWARLLGSIEKLYNTGTLFIAGSLNYGLPNKPKLSIEEKKSVLMMKSYFDTSLK